MAALPAIVLPCVDEAVARSARMLGRAVDEAGAAFEEELRSRGTVDRPLISAALRELPALRMEWCAAFPSALKAAIQSGKTGQPTPMASPSSLTLTLVDESDVLQSIEASRLAQVLDAMVERSLKELDAYMSSALQLEGIQPESNPLRPAVIAQALRSAMGASQAQEQQVALWMRYMAETLADELESLYRACCKLLAAANVKAAGYRVVTGPAPLTAKELAPPNGSHSRPQALASRPQALDSRPGELRERADGGGRTGAISGLIELATRALRGPVLRDFLFGSSPQAQQPLAPAYYQQVDQELAALEARWDEASPDPEIERRYQHLPAVERPMREVGTESPLNREVWGPYGAPRQRSLVRTRLRKKAQRVGQVLGLEVVHQMVDQVAQDPRLLAPVREAIVALEPSLGRLAMHSPRFFGEQQNPARKLLEAVAQRSFKYNDEFANEFHSFFAAVTASFNALNRVESLDDAQPFESALAALSQSWDQQDGEEEKARAEMLRTVQLAERRQADANQIAWDLSQRSDLDGVPSVVQDFLFGPWTLVIAHARITQRGTDMDPGGYIGIVTDLLWSTKRDLTLRDPARAFEAIPRVLVKLRAGLDLTGHPPGETDAFFEALERLHRPVLKLRAKHRRQAMPEPAADVGNDEDLQPAPARKPASREEVWLREAELRTCGFEDTLPSDYAELEPVAARGADVKPAASVTPIPVTRVAGVALAAGQADALIESLGEGAWVDLFSKQRWLRARLSWASGNRTLFMFVSHGGRPHSMTRRSLHRLVASRLLRPVSTHEVVQHALDTLQSPQAQALAA